MIGEHKPLNQVSKKREVNTLFIDNSAIQDVQPNHLLFPKPFSS